MAHKFRIKKGDTVIVLSGKNRNKTGKVMQVHPADNTVTVDGINIIKRHYKPSTKMPKGGIAEVAKPINASKIAILDPATKTASRIGYKIDKDGNKTRFYKKSGKDIA